MISSSYYIEGITVKPRVTQACIPNIRLGSSVWQNPVNRYDVIGNGLFGQDRVGINDYNALQDWLDENGEQDLPPEKPAHALWLDVNGDGRADNNDLIALADFLNDGAHEDTTPETCFPVNGFSVERDLITPRAGITAREVGTKVGAQPYTDYRVFRRNFSTQALFEVTYTTVADVKDSLVFVHRDLFELPDCVPIKHPPSVLTRPYDILLLFDDTGSFSGVAPILTQVFSSAVASLQSSLPNIDFAFGVARFEEYGGDFVANQGAADNRPFILNQPIISASDPQFDAAMTSALNRTAPGGGGDLPEAIIEALYQAATGAGFDGDADGSKLGSGPAGLVTTQISPGSSGDVPPFSSFVEDPTGPVVAGVGSFGGAGFRGEAVHLILLATDAAFAYEPDGHTVYTGKNGVKVSAEDIQIGARSTTPGHRGATIQKTIDALINLDGGNGCQVVGLGTNSNPSLAPRRPLEAFAKLTGALNQSNSNLDSGIPGDPITPGQPMYFRINIGSADTIAAAIVAAVNATTVTIPAWFTPCPPPNGCGADSDILGRLQLYLASNPEILPLRFVWP
jgi:hypothetical protein